MVTETAANAATVLTGRAAHPQPLRLRQLDGGALDDLTALGRDVPDEEVTKRRPP